MKQFLLLLLVTTLIGPVFSQSKVPSKEIQIKTATLAAPADKRDGATVYGYSDDNRFILLKEGQNELICTADDPSQPGFSVACYHKDLHPFMQRGRDLRKEGKKQPEVFDTREKEAKSGALLMPKQPATLVVVTAKDDDFNRSTGDVNNTYIRSVVYIPYATAESTGLPLKPQAPGMPWLMDPGTHGAHIMINPPVAEKK